MKLWHAAVLAGAMFVVGALVCRPDTSLARAEFERDSLKVVADSLQAQDQRRAIADAAAADSTRRREAAIDSLTALADSLERVTQTIVAQIHLFPELVPRRLVDNLIVTHAQAMQAERAKSDSLRAQLLTTRVQLAGSNASARGWRTLALDRGRALDNALKHRRWGCVVGASATVGPSIAGTQASLFGGAIGIGASCGRKFL